MINPRRLAEPQPGKVGEGDALFMLIRPINGLDERTCCGAI